MLISIIIVEYHSIEEIKRCLSSIQRTIMLPYEIIVSSNSCYNENERPRESDYADNVRWVYNETNGGFAYAMNKGLKKAKGDYLIIMNSDCSFTESLQPIVNFLQSHPEVGAIAPRIIDHEGNIQDTARPYVSLPRFLWRQIRRIITREISILNTSMDYNKIQTVDWVIGAFIMVTRHAYDRVGGLDESFFMYAEDIDWCTRIRKHGYEVVYYPKVTIKYKGTRRARENAHYALIFLKSHIGYWRKYGFFYGYPKRQELKSDK